jgi:hypothetical protein
METPQAEVVVFIVLKKRPKEALFRTYKNTTSGEELQ